MNVRIIKFVAIGAVVILMSACSPMNSEFSCNATAGDSCMTIEQVDAMTRYADGAHRAPIRSRIRHMSKPVTRQSRGAQALVWVAPKMNRGAHQLGGTHKNVVQARA